MRLVALVFAACSMLPVVASAQVTNSYLGRNYTPPDTVIRQAPMDGWRNYVTVPDGPCGYPMSVQADCYTGCGGCCCGPLVFLHRCKVAVLSCLLLLREPLSRLLGALPLVTRHPRDLQLVMNI